jgi:long-subunit acyl-CoA synthetase (AMP-forming)
MAMNPTPKNFKTSGTTWTPKDINVSPEVWQARIAAMATSKPSGYAAIKSWYNETRKNAAGFQKHSAWAAKNGVTIYEPAGGTIAAAIALWKANSIQGIVSSCAGLFNFASAQPGYQFKMLLSTGTMLTKYRSQFIRATLGTNLWVSYASTETDTIAFAFADQAEATPGYVGMPVPGVTVSVISGEICVKTPCLASNAPVDAQGWYHTGDLGALADDGGIVLSGRSR